MYQLLSVTSMTRRGFNFPDTIAKGLSTGITNQFLAGLKFTNYMQSRLQVHEMLEFTAATRYSDYSIFGNTTNSKLECC